MNTFTLVRPDSFREAAREHQARADVSLPMYKAGGMDVVDHLKEGLADPDVLIDIRRLDWGVRRLVDVIEQSIIAVLDAFGVSAHGRPPSAFISDR